jgi:alpha-tubulin suppressor-like RCC1 family protein
VIAAPAPYTSVAAGGDHTCGLTTGGAAVCWGRNDQGQLGRGGTPGNPALPAPVATTLRFALLVSGSGHSCGLATGGLTYCWGLDFAGQLGDGGTTFSDTPRPAITDTAFATLSAGSNHTCALTTGGRAFCWGANPLGQLGDSTRANRGTPVAVAGALVFTRLSAGGVHTCGLTATGAGYCWGANIAGQLGTGTADSLEISPQPVAGGLRFRVIAAGGAHTCGLTTDSLAYCWGNNADGELGAGATSSQPTTMPVPVSGALHFADLHAGSAHTCGITGAQIVYCWGLGLRGQLGQVTLHTSAVPLRVAGQP